MTNEDIAKRITDSSVTASGQGVLLVDGKMVDVYRRPHLVEQVAKRLREAILPLLQKAREEGAKDVFSTPMMSPPLNREGLDEIDKRWENGPRKIRENFERSAHDASQDNWILLERATLEIPLLLKHIQYLERQINDMAQDGKQDIWNAGFKAGARSRDEEWGRIQDGKDERERLGID